MLIALMALISSAQTSVILLGTGTPVPDPERAGAATAIVVNGEAYLVDCGSGVVRRTAAAARKYKLDALAPRNIKRVFITHLHSDHTLGYPDLILTPWVVGRTFPLESYGPKGLKAMTSHLLAAYEEDIVLRVNGLERGNTGGHTATVHEINPGVIYQDKNVKVTAFRVKHGSWSEAFGYRFDTPDKSIVISGDTAPSDGLEQAASGVSILIHEVYNAASLKPEERPGGEHWLQYMRTFHTSDIELGKLAARVKPQLLVLYHVVGPGADLLIQGVREGGYRGEVVIANDLAKY